MLNFRREDKGDYFTALLPIVELAINFHAGQMYGNASYVDGHLVKVMLEMKHLIGTNASREDQCVYGATAILHDILEDTDISKTQLTNVAGFEVVTYVEALTKRHGETYDEYLLRVVEHEVSYRVKVADITCNMRQNVFEGNRTRAAAYSTKLALLHTLREQAGK